PWDIELVGRRLIIREAARQFLLDIRFDPPGRVVIEHGLFALNGIEVIVAPRYLLLVNIQMVIAGYRSWDYPYGLILGTDDMDGALCLVRHDALERGVSDEARAAAIRHAEGEMRRVT